MENGTGVLEALWQSFPDDEAFMPPEDAEWSSELKRRGDEIDADALAAVSITDVSRRIEVELDGMEPK